MSEFEGTEREKDKPSRTPERKMQDGAGRQAGVTSSWEPREAPAGFDPVKFQIRLREAKACLRHAARTQSQS